MSITVKFRTSGGENTSRRFASQAGVSVFGSVTSLGVPSVGAHVRIEINSGDMAGYFQEQQVNLYGDYAFWLQLPRGNGRATVRVTARYAISGTEYVDIPIAWGTVTPETLPDPPKPEEDKGFFGGITDQIIDFVSSIKWVLILALVAVGLYFAIPLFKSKK